MVIGKSMRIGKLVYFEMDEHFMISGNLHMIQYSILLRV